MQEFQIKNKILQIASYNRLWCQANSTFLCVSYKFFPIESDNPFLGGGGGGGGGE